MNMKTYLNIIIDWLIHWFEIDHCPCVVILCFGISTATVTILCLQLLSSTIYNLLGVIKGWAYD